MVDSKTLKKDEWTDFSQVKPPLAKACLDHCRRGQERAGDSFRERPPSWRLKVHTSIHRVVEKKPPYQTLTPLLSLREQVVEGLMPFSH